MYFQNRCYWVQIPIKESTVEIKEEYIPGLEFNCYFKFAHKMMLRGSARPFQFESNGRGSDAPGGVLGLECFGGPASFRWVYLPGASGTNSTK